MHEPFLCLSKTIASRAREEACKRSRLRPWGDAGGQVASSCHVLCCPILSFGLAQQDEATFPSALITLVPWTIQEGDFSFFLMAPRSRHISAHSICSRRHGSPGLTGYVGVEASSTTGATALRSASRSYGRTKIKQSR